ncbi:MAG: chloramphenicol-sensitive protein RarD, partial [Pseudonocardiales bacterium]|nr:chloramphenicol-sensitive protein RarD [Pseudonocardiales bacterium]
MRPSVRRLGIPVVTSPEQRRAGLAYGAGAYLLWGLFPLYWPLLEPANAIEILAHRMIWSLLFMLIL